jgi:hypothetical protein
MTPVSFTLTSEDMIAGNRLALRRYLKKGAPRYALGVLLAAVGVTLIAYAFRAQALDRMVVVFLEILAIYAALAILLIVFLLFVAPHQRAKKNFKQMPALSREQTVSWDEGEIAFTSKYGSVSIPYGDLHQWAADEELVILYPADHLFHMLPSRVFQSETDRTALISALKNNAVKRI